MSAKKPARERIKAAAMDLLEKASDAHAAGMVLAQRSAMVAQLGRMLSDEQAEELADEIDRQGLVTLTTSRLNSMGGCG